MNGWQLEDVRALTIDEYDVLIEEINKVNEGHE